MKHCIFNFLESLNSLNTHPSKENTEINLKIIHWIFKGQKP